MSATLAAWARPPESASAADDLLPVPSGALEIAPATGRCEVALSVVIPTFNERENLRRVVQRLADVLEEPLGGDYEIIVVDDNSPDGTWAAARRLRAEIPRLRVMRRAGERGRGTAVIRGFQAARGAALAVMHATLEHPPELVHALLRHVLRGADLAVAGCHVGGGRAREGSVLRRLVARGARMLGELLLPGVVGRVSDPLSGYFVVRRASIAGVRMGPPGHDLLVEILARARIRRIAEVGYTLREHPTGERGPTFGRCVDYLRHLLRLRAGSS